VGRNLVEGKYAQTVAEGKALADDGDVYDSIQMAVDNASSYVKVGPGEFRESVTIDTAGLTLQGSGERTLIDGNSRRSIYITKSDVSIINVSLLSIGSDALLIDGVSNIIVKGCLFRDNNSYGFNYTNNCSEIVITNSKVETGNGGFRVPTRSIVNNNDIFETRSNAGIIPGAADDCIVSNNRVFNSAEIGVKPTGNDCIIIGNRIFNSDKNGVNCFNSTDSIVANNRISASGSTDIVTGTGTLLDSNLVT
jgi:pectin methylesterase-like acyl-CoA thioesterase